MQEHYVRVLVPLRLDWIPVYRTELPLKRGDYVNVALSGRNYIGIVWECDAVPDISSGRILPVLSAAEGIPAASEREMKFWAFLSEYYLCSLGEVYKAARPAQLLRAWQAELRRMERTENARLARKEALDSAVARLELRLAALEEKISSPHRSEAVVSGLVSRKERILAQLEEKRKAAAALSGREDIPAPAPAANTGRPLVVHGTQRLQTYLEAVTEALDAGGQVLILTPETAFCERLETFFSQRLGSRLHTAGSPARRGRTAIALQQGAGIAVVSTKNGIFLPFSRLSLIIIDEEHEGTYKSEQTPRYHARETAIHRAKEEGASVVLGSATPSLESFYACRSGEIQMLKLGSRTGGGRLPRVWITDMREELRKGNRSILSDRLEALIRQRLERKEQIMLFLNRRGYAGFVSCRACGYVVKCPHCDVALSAHRNGRLVCHYCGYEQPELHSCPSCGSSYIGGFKAGTQQVEELIQKRFPEARLLRMDLDTTRKKDSYERILEAFSDGEADILIGTQMIVKGHDFHRVTLVGILAADLSLYCDDYRSGERTFQLLTQAAGRAGRGTGEGEVVIQTYSPDHYSIQRAADQDYEGFFEEEMRYRTLMGYPPAAHLLAILLSGEKEEEVNLAAGYLKGFIKRIDPEGRIQVIGPASPHVGKVADLYRRVLYLKEQDAGILIEAKNRMEQYIEANRGFTPLRIQFDLDPMGIF